MSFISAIYKAIALFFFSICSTFYNLRNKKKFIFLTLLLLKLYLLKTSKKKLVINELFKKINTKKSILVQFSKFWYQNFP